MKTESKIKTTTSTFVIVNASDLFNGFEPLLQAMSESGQFTWGSDSTILTLVTLDSVKYFVGTHGMDVAGGWADIEDQFLDHCKELDSDVLVDLEN